MNLALVRLLHLASPTLPVGAYTYSQGLEWAVESGDVRDEAGALAWIGACLEHGVARFEAVYLAHMMRAWTEGDAARLAELDGEFLASRETAELRAETLQMGHSLMKLISNLTGLVIPVREPSPPAPPPGGEGCAPQGDFLRDAAARERVAILPSLGETVSFPLAWSCAAAQWQIPVEDAVAAYLWSWAENQVMAALKAVPLGQTAGQRLLMSLGERLPALARDAVATPLDATHNLLPALAIASSRHETQYTRIFRS